jgi:NADH:ubiquinone oxidoreductase subunit H
VIPQHATKSLFYLAPIISLIFSLLGWGVQKNKECAGLKKKNE